MCIARRGLAAFAGAAIALRKGASVAVSTSGVERPTKPTVGMRCCWANTVCGDTAACPECAEGPAVSFDCPAIRKEQFDHSNRRGASRVDSPESPLMGWSGRAPALPAREAGKGRSRQGARHVSETQRSDRRDRH
jgi:hypothetical protein